jgi:hypothetical protein
VFFVFSCFSGLFPISLSYFNFSCINNIKTYSHHLNQSLKKRLQVLGLLSLVSILQIYWNKPQLFKSEYASPMSCFKFFGDPEKIRIVHASIISTISKLCYSSKTSTLDGVC